MEDRKTMAIAGGLLALFLISSVAVVLTLQAPERSVPAPVEPAMEPQALENRLSRIESGLSERIARIERAAGNGPGIDYRLRHLEQKLERLERSLSEQRTASQPNPEIEALREMADKARRLQALPAQRPMVPYGSVSANPPSASTVVPGPVPRLKVEQISGNVRLKAPDGRWWQLTSQSDFDFAPGSCIAVSSGSRLVYSNGDQQRSTLNAQSLLRARGTGDCKPRWSSHSDVQPLYGRLEEQQGAR